MGVTLHQRAGTPLITAVLGLTAGVFVLDLVLPLGIAVAMLYAIPLLVTSKRLPRTFTLGLAAMGIIVVVITGLMWLLGVRRDTEINLKEGTVKTSDSTVARAAATSVTPVTQESGNG